MERRIKLKAVGGERSVVHDRVHILHHMRQIALNLSSSYARRVMRPRSHGDIFQGLAVTPPLERFCEFGPKNHVPFMAEITLTGDP
jgi:hypothetical protein